VYLDDGISYGYQKGEFAREEFTCKVTAQGLRVTIGARKGSFAPWWKYLSVEVYGASKAAAGASTGDVGASKPVATNFDAQLHRITAVVPDDGKGLELRLAY
jgi:alpha-glucosidase